MALVAAGVCDAETIDTVVREGFGARTAVLGPMEQADLVGLDLQLDVAEVLYATLTVQRGRTRSCATRSRLASLA